jgi:hypothetical protein
MYKEGLRLLKVLSCTAYIGFLLIILQKSANRESTSDVRSRSSAKRLKGNNCQNEEIGDFIVVDMGDVDITEDTKPFKDTRTEDRIEATLHGDRTAV